MKFYRQNIIPFFLLNPHLVLLPFTFLVHNDDNPGPVPFTTGPWQLQVGGWKMHNPLDSNIISSHISNFRNAVLQMGRQREMNAEI